jgi:hypothetical protein
MERDSCGHQGQGEARTNEETPGTVEEERYE